MMGIDPKQLVKVQDVTKFITAEIRLEASKNQISLVMNSDNAEALVVIPQLLDQMATSLATQLSTYFAIKGEIVEVGP